MAKTIELELSDALYAQVSAEAESSGQRLFAYIRSKLSSHPAPQRRKDVIREDDDQQAGCDKISAIYRSGELLPQAAIARQNSVARDDVAEARFARIEETLSGLTAFLTQQYAVAAEPAEPQPAQPIDLDAMVDSQVAQAEVEGRTEYVADPAREVMHVAGVRPLAKRPTPFAATNQPRYLQGL